MLRTVFARAIARLFGSVVPLSKSTPPGRLKDITVKRIALCRRGKNGLKTLLKADGSLIFETLCKADALQETGELLAVIYAPERPDSDGNLADRAEIRKACHLFGKVGHKEVDLEHNGKPLSLEDVYPAESFIVQKSDMRFHDWKDYDGKSAGDLEGAWAMLYRIENPELRAAYRSGEWDGVSLFGHGAVEPLTKSSAPENLEMDEAKLKALLGEFKTGLLAEVTTLVKAAVAPVPETPAVTAKPKDEVTVIDAALSFDGDIDNPDDLVKLEKCVRTRELNALLKSGKVTAKQIAELRKAVTVTAECDDAAQDPNADDQTDDSASDAPPARKKSNAPPAKKPLVKADLLKAQLDEGDEIAKLYNEQNAMQESGSFKIVSK